MLRCPVEAAKRREKKPEKEEKVKENKQDDKKTFAFDPEIHHIEHRGFGKYYIMDKEDVVHGPLTKAEAEALEK